MAGIIRREMVYFWYYFSIQFNQIFRYWVLGMVLGSVISVFFKDGIHRMFRSLGEKKPGIAGILACGFYDELHSVKSAACHLQCGIGTDGACRAHCELFFMWKSCGSSGPHFSLAWEISKQRVGGFLSVSYCQPFFRDMSLRRR